jgi:hypothetical protein
MGDLLNLLWHHRSAEWQFSGSNDAEAAVLECVGLTASRHRALILNDDRADLTTLDAHALYQSHHLIDQVERSPEISFRVCGRNREGSRGFEFISLP